MTYSSREPSIKIEDREQEVVFTNWTDKIYEGRWDFSKNHKIWKIEPKQSVYLPFYLAEHFAEGLVEREMQTLASKKVNEELERAPALSAEARPKFEEKIEQGIYNNNILRSEMLNKCVDRYRQEEKASRVKVEYVRLKEVVLKRDIANKAIKEEHEVDTQINEKALKQQEEDTPQQNETPQIEENKEEEFEEK